MESMAFGGPGAVLLLLIALAVDAVIGGVKFFQQMAPGPSRLVRIMGTELDRRLNRPERGEFVLMIRGAVVALGVVGLSGSVGLLIQWLSRTLEQGFVLELVALVSCLAGRAVADRVRAIRVALASSILEVARKEVEPLTRRDVANFDQYAIARAAIEGLAKAFSQDVIAPAFWYILLGLPGAFLWTAANSLDSAIGRRSPRHEHFGMTAARLDDALHFIPARLAGLLIVAAAPFLGSTHPLRACRTVLREARFHPSLNNGWPVAALAGALNLALVGPWQQGNVRVREVWIGHGRAKAGPGDLDRAMALLAVAAVLFVGLLALLMGALVL